MLFTTPDLGDYISGAILYEETLFQNHADGTPFVDCLNKIGVIPGIKVDTGLSPLPGGHEVETWCSGLDGLVERAKKYYAQGARFAKWRAVLQITSDGAPSNLSIQVSVLFGTLLPLWETPKMTHEEVEVICILVFFGCVGRRLWQKPQPSLSSLRCGSVTVAGMPHPVASNHGSARPLLVWRWIMFV